MAQTAPDDLVRPGAHADHRLYPAGRGVPRAHPGPALRGRDHRGRRHRLLRRVLPELRACADIDRAPGRRQRQAGRHPVVRAGSRTRPRRRPGRAGRRRRGHGGGRDLLRRLGGLPGGHQPPRRTTALATRRSLRAEIAEGLSFVLRHPILRKIVACTGTANLFGGMASPLQIIFLVRVLRRPARRHRPADRRGQPGRSSRRGAVRPPWPRHRLGPHHLVLAAGPRFPGPARPAGRARLARCRLPARPGGLPVRRGGLQRGAAQLPAGDLPAGPARPDERRGPLGGLGHDPARRAARRRVRQPAGRAPDAVDRVRRQLGAPAGGCSSPRSAASATSRGATT